MGLADRASTLGPYAQYAWDNEDVQANLQRALTASRDAYGRARGKKGKAQAAQDRKVQERVLEAAQAARDVVAGMGRERAKQQRNRRGRVALVVGIGVAGAGGAIALVPQLREKVLARFGGDSSGAPPAPAGPVQ
jgi:hypothetical protein